MSITFDPAKRKTTLAERGLDFADDREKARIAPLLEI